MNCPVVGRLARGVRPGAPPRATGRGHGALPLGVRLDLADAYCDRIDRQIAGLRAALAAAHAAIVAAGLSAAPAGSRAAAKAVAAASFGRPAPPLDLGTSIVSQWEDPPE
jgi:hypothetical protein